MTKFTDATPMPFGKHRGTKLEDVPPSYLLWLLDKMMEDDDRARLAVYLSENRKALELEARDEGREDDE